MYLPFGIANTVQSHMERRYSRPTVQDGEGAKLEASTHGRDERDTAGLQKPSAACSMTIEWLSLIITVVIAAVWALRHLPRCQAVA